MGSPALTRPAPPRGLRREPSRVPRTQPGPLSPAAPHPVQAGHCCTPFPSRNFPRAGRGPTVYVTGRVLQHLLPESHLSRLWQLCAYRPCCRALLPVWGRHVTPSSPRPCSLRAAEPSDLCGTSHCRDRSGWSRPGHHLGDHPRAGCSLLAHGCSEELSSLVTVLSLIPTAHTPACSHLNQRQQK